MAQAAERVLSIQSHVVFGYVGGKAAVFPLQCLGYDVDVVNTVNFSNHSGYGRIGGTKATATELNAIFKTMEQNELLIPTRLLTGYIPGAEALSAVQKLATKVKHLKPGLIYLLDPVMGDTGQLYVAPDVVPVYREMLPLATVITPNWYEVEVLTEIQLKDMDSLRCALTKLHDDYGVPNIVITSIPLKPWLLEALPSNLQPNSRSEHLICISSSIFKGSSRRQRPFLLHVQCVPLIPGYFSGVGDLFSALLLAHFNPDSTISNEGDTETPLSFAASQALIKTHAILQITNDRAKALPEAERLPSDDEQDAADILRKTRRMRGRELALIKGQDILRGLASEKTKHLQVWDTFWHQ